MKFEVGDTVKVVRRDYGSLGGKIGTIVKDYNHGTYGVDFGYNWGSGHDCGGTCPYGHGYNLESNQLILIGKKTSFKSFMKRLDTIK